MDYVIHPFKICVFYCYAFIQATISQLKLLKIFNRNVFRKSNK